MIESNSICAIATPCADAIDAQPCAVAHHVAQDALTSAENYMDSLTTEPSLRGATRLVTKTLFTLAFGLLCIGYLPWFLQPIGMLITAIAMGSLYLISRDCQQQIFFKSKLLNSAVGFLAALPLFGWIS